MMKTLQNKTCVKVYSVLRQCSSERFARHGNTNLTYVILTHLKQSPSCFKTPVHNMHLRYYLTIRNIDKKLHVLPIALTVSKNQ